MCAAMRCGFVRAIVVNTPQIAGLVDATPFPSGALPTPAITEGERHVTEAADARLNQIAPRIRCNLFVS